MRNAILAIGVLCFIASCATSGPPAVDKDKMSEGYMKKGYAYLEANRLELALSEFHHSIQENPKNKWSCYYLGVTYDKLGKLADAEKYYGEAIDIDSDFSEAHNALGVVYAQEKKWNEAIKSFQKALANKLYATRYIPYLNMGDVYMSQQNYAKAIDAYRESKRYEKIDIIIIKLGDALFEAGKTLDAIQEYQEAASMSPSNALVRYKLAVSYLKNGNKREATSEFQKAAELAPRDEIAVKSREYLKTLR